MTSAEDREKYVKRQWYMHGLLFQMIILFILILLPAVNVNYPLIAGFPFYTFWAFFILPLVGLINITIWFKKIVKLDREQIRKGEEMWR